MASSSSKISFSMRRFGWSIDFMSSISFLSWDTAFFMRAFEMDFTARTAPVTFSEPFLTTP